MSPNPLPITADCWFLTGPTASGKTSIALELAGQLGAEIISLDSMALYRGMDIGTAKPSVADRQRVAHHLIDLVAPSQDFSLAQYVEAAERAVSEIRARASIPLFVGGTPLYLKALLRGIFKGPPADWNFRRQLEAVVSEQGEQTLHARLSDVDPDSARRLHPRDTRRIIRALEVWEITGSTISQLQKQFDRARSAERCRVFVIDRPREQLHARIDQRVEAMFHQGLVEEVRGLLGDSAGLSRTASQALGYRETIEYLQDRHTLAETVALVKLRTRQFAKRQRTWFRSLSECRWIATTDSALPEEIARTIAAMSPAG
jgi:tRNA dimethylallyltransferase